MAGHLDPGWRTGDVHPDELEDLLFQAARLYYRLTSGSAPEPLPTTVRLTEGEAAYFDGQVECSRYDFLELEEKVAARLLGPSTLTAWFSRTETQPKWRPTGVHRVVLTDRRLLVLEHGQWITYRHDAIAEYQSAPGEFVLTLTFHEIAPLRLSGPDLAWLTVMYAAMLYPPEKLVELPGFERFDPEA